jgi:exosortase A-associated hydrolase 1
MESAIVIQSDGHHLVAVLHRPDRASRRGIFLVPPYRGYRVGDHRQFVRLARRWAIGGVDVLRFDYRGQGDSSGDSATTADVLVDMRRALDAWFARVDGLEEVVIWGLCSAARWAALYGAGDPRVKGLVLVNPRLWKADDPGLARIRLMEYLKDRGSRLRDVLGKVVTFRVDYRGALQLMAVQTARLLPRPGRVRAHDSLDTTLDQLGRFEGRILLILSTADPLLKELELSLRGNTAARRLLESEKTTRIELAGADHTLSYSVWTEQVAADTLAWLRSSW